MDEAMRTLGQRIIDAARAAALMHLQLLQDHAGTPRQQAIGGADMPLSKDGMLSLGDDHPRRSSSIAERRAG